VLEEMKATKGVHPDSRSYNYLLSSYQLYSPEQKQLGAAGGTDDSEKEAATAVTGSSIRARVALRREAEAVMTEMALYGTQSSPSVHSYASLLDVYNSLKLPTDIGLQAVRQMVDRDSLRPTALILNTLLKPFAESGDGRGAFALASRIVSGQGGMPRVVPDGRTMVLLVGACSKRRLEARSTAPMIHAWLGPTLGMATGDDTAVEITSNDVEWSNIDGNIDGSAAAAEAAADVASDASKISEADIDASALFLFTALVQHAGMAGDINQAWRWFEQLKARTLSRQGTNHATAAQLSIGSLHALAIAFGRASDGFAKAPSGHIHRLMGEFQAAGITPNLITFNILLSALQHATVALERSDAQKEGGRVGEKLDELEGVVEGAVFALGGGDEHGDEQGGGDLDDDVDDHFDADVEEAEQPKWWLEEGQTDDDTPWASGVASSPLPSSFEYAPEVPDEKHRTPERAKAALLALMQTQVGRSIAIYSGQK
jgi:hypothetical protein